MTENREERSGFFRSALSFNGSASKKILFPLLVFFSYSVCITIIHNFFFPLPKFDLTPFEICGAFLGILLVFRTNAGYERWWEARKLWGGIVNQSRNLAIASMSYVPQRNSLLKKFLLLIVRFPFATKDILRANPAFRTCNIKKVSPAVLISWEMANILSAWKKQALISPMAFFTLDVERKKLIDYLGACERILKTPMPLAYAIKTRRFLFIFLLLVPVGIVFDAGWSTPFITLLVAYPLLGLDQIGKELQNPFSKNNLSHLPLDNICKTIEKDVLALSILKEKGEKTIKEHDLLSEQHISHS